MQVASPQTQAPGPPIAYTIDPSPASRRQYLQQSPQPGESPRAHSSTRSGSSPHSSKRPSRRPSDNAPQLGISENAQLAQHQSPPSAHLSAPHTPRTQDSSMANQSSPLSSSTIAAPSYQQPRREGRGQQQQQGAPPFEPPPRTSSNHRGQSANPSSNPTSNERTVPYRSANRDDRPSSSRTANTSGGRNFEDRDKPYAENRVTGNEREAGPDAASVAAAAARSRRRGPASPEGPQRAISTREAGAHQSPSTVQSRSATSVAITTPPARPPKEEIINRIVVTDPQIDIEREQERLAEAVPDQGRVASGNADDGGRAAGQRRQDYSASAARRKDTKFGEYVLGQTLGEGEFGKVKLGWKKDGSVQVAIKLIRRESLGTNPSRLPKIYREISILRGLSHPNIVRLHEMVETDKYIGIILEYASGGELFDYILTHRYLKDHAARKLFAQLVSGVGYLHKKGIVHRDLKLENLLLDRNRNIIITDFGFANTFNAQDELSDDIEYNLTDREFVKRNNLEQIVNGSRKGDLMQTSCGSPCYAAPELVVTDSLYTGRKVDVWSCGVILYAMLAGYLPFDDDPANPEGDNINLLYKYIVSTPLTFPEYVTPHARDLLRRILVPDPRKRADLFEVARHSWLSEYAHIVSHVTSSTTTVGEIANATITSDQQEAPLLARSASVREPTKIQPSNMSPVGGLTHQGKMDPEQSADRTKTPRDKRRTVQVEYVAPQSQTVRGEATPSVQSPATVGSASAAAPSSSKTRARAGSEGPEGVRQAGVAAATSKPLPQEPSIMDNSLPYHPGFSGSTKTQQRPSGPQQVMAPPTRPTKEVPRSTSDYVGLSGPLSTSTVARPTTGGSMSSAGRLPSRGNSYSQPLAPTVAATNAQGRLAQPKNGKQYNISNPIPQSEYYFQEGSIGRPGTRQYEQPVPFASRQDQSRGHKRSNTLGSVFGRSGSFFGGRSQAPQEQIRPQQEKKYPPTSMKGPIASDSPRLSTDSRRSSSFGFGRKSSDLRKTGDSGKQEKPRRFSLLPASFSFKSFTGSTKDQSTENILPVSERRPSVVHQQPPASRGQPRPATTTYGRGQSRSDSFRKEEGMPTGYDGYDGQRERARGSSTQQARRSNAPSSGAPQPQQSYGSPQYNSQQDPYGSLQAPAGQSYLLGESGTPTESEVSLGMSQHHGPYPPGFNEFDDEPRPSMQQSRSGRGAGVLQKDNRRFADAYEQGQGGGHHAGSSGAAKRVMDFFRRRGKARAGDERV